MLNVQVTAYGGQTVPDRSVVRSCDPLQNFGGSNHMTGTAEPKVVKFCTEVGYINSSTRMTYHPQKVRGYGHVTVLKFCRLPWCSASLGFVNDSWATCLHTYSISYHSLRMTTPSKAGVVRVTWNVCRSTLRQSRPNKAGLKCSSAGPSSCQSVRPYVRPSVRPSVPPQNVFFRFQ